MSHLRDLQRLRNTKNNFQIKRAANPNTGELRLNELRNPRPSHHNQDLVIMPELTRPIDLEQEVELDPYSKYMQSKEILSGRESRDRQS